METKDSPVYLIIMYYIEKSNGTKKESFDENAHQEHPLPFV